MKVAKQRMNILLIFRKITLLAVYCMDWRETGGREMRKENLQGSVGSVRNNDNFKKVAVGW